MFIIWGKKQKRFPEGYIANWCSVCHDIREFKVTRIHLASHVYYISFSKGEPVGHTFACQHCGAEHYRNLDQAFHTASESKPLDLLIEETNPNCMEIWHDDVVLSEKMRQRPQELTPAERQHLLIQPLYHLSYLAEKQGSNITLTGLLTGAGAIVLGAAISGLLIPLVDHPLWAAGITGGSIAGLLYLSVSYNRNRFMRREVYARLKPLYLALQPSEAELNQAKIKLKPTKLNIGHWLNARALLKFLSDSPATAQR
ncbi:hypothetical protein [Undibacterium luofuense]|uniref:hypothetical protein n=1 Tax=Undibacterium luofuense TaxID=2828733 RepID=UPI0030EC4DAD